jgi:hypothetical protein
MADTYGRNRAALVDGRHQLRFQGVHKIGYLLFGGMMQQPDLLVNGRLGGRLFIDRSLIFSVTSAPDKTHQAHRHKD